MASDSQPHGDTDETRTKQNQLDSIFSFPFSTIMAYKEWKIDTNIASTENGPVREKYPVKISPETQQELNLKSDSLILAVVCANEQSHIVQKTVQSGVSGLYMPIPSDVLHRLGVAPSDEITVWFTNYNDFSDTNINGSQKRTDSLTNDAPIGNWIFVTETELYYRESRDRLSGEVCLSSDTFRAFVETEPDQQIKLRVEHSENEVVFTPSIVADGKRITIPSEQREALDLSKDNPQITVWAHVNHLAATIDSKKTLDSHQSTSNNSTGEEIEGFSLSQPNIEQDSKTSDTPTEKSVEKSDNGQENGTEKSAEKSSVSPTPTREQLQNTQSTPQNQPQSIIETDPGAVVGSNSVAEPSNGSGQQLTNTVSVDELAARIGDHNADASWVEAVINPDVIPVVALDETERKREDWPAHYMTPDDGLLCGRTFDSVLKDPEGNHRESICAECALAGPGKLSDQDLSHILSEFTDVSFSDEAPFLLDQEDAAKFITTLLQMNIKKG